MNKKLIWKIGVGVAAVFAIIIGFSFYGDSTSSPRSDSFQYSRVGNITLSIAGFYNDKSVPISADESVLQVLRTLDSQDPELKLSTKEYAGLGTLVDGMRGFKNGDGGKYWQYKVNDVMPQIGADKLTLKDGDAVEWFFDVSRE